jgi:hypothetical protein
MMKDTVAGVSGRAETYEQWREWVIGKAGHDWQYAGDWFFPAPRNKWPKHSGTFYHICRENWKLDNDDTVEIVESCKESCQRCGEEIPEGIKMIAMLLSW